MPTQAIDAVFYVLVLIMSVVVHEFAHGYAAYLLGDQTARLKGRLTLNPLKHLDLFGSILLPALLILSKAGFILGWARPVPYNPENFKDQKKGTMIVSLVGILANITIAVVFALFIRFLPFFGFPPYAMFSPHPFYVIATSIVMVNLVLALFNLVPIPPLDGSKFMFALVPPRYKYIEDFLERWGMFFLLFFIIFLWGKVSPIVFWVFSFLTGL